jgi:hypothetical protein
MNELSVGASLTWQITAREAAAAKHQYIEKEHKFICTCSLEMVLRYLEPPTPDVKQAFLGHEIPFGVYTKNHREEMLRKVRSVFRPEFLNRIDELILFKPLGQEDIHKIAQIMLGSLNSLLKEKGISLQGTQNAIDFICRKGYDPAKGARLLQREIERMIAQPLSEKILKGDFAQRDVINVDATSDEITLKKEVRD